MSSTRDSALLPSETPPLDLLLERNRRGLLAQA